MRVRVILEVFFTAESAFLFRDRDRSFPVPSPSRHRPVPRLSSRLIISGNKKELSKKKIKNNVKNNIKNTIKKDVILPPT